MRTEVTVESLTLKDNQAKCLFCGKVFKKKKSWQKFCISKHRDAWHNLQKALEEFNDRPN